MIALWAFWGCFGDPLSPGTPTTDTDECPSDLEFFKSELWPTVSTTCAACHNPDGPAQNTRMILDSGDLDASYTEVQEMALLQDDAGYLLLLKPIDQHPDGHGGGPVLEADSDVFSALELFVGRINGFAEPCDPEVDIPTEDSDLPIDCDVGAPGRRLLRRLSHVEYDQTVSDLLGFSSSFGANFAPDNVAHGYANNGSQLQVSPLLISQYSEAAEALAEIYVESRLHSDYPCSESSPDAACAVGWITSFGKRAFRRSLQTEEAQAYVDFFAEVHAEEGFDVATQWVLTAMLQSPHFLYRTELGVLQDGTYQLTSWEIASELSYLYWQTMPDASLFALAEADVLQDPAVIEEQAARLLDDPRAVDTWKRMSFEWLEFDQLSRVSKDASTYPEFTEEIRNDMMGEAERLVAAAFLDGDGLDELLSAEHRFLTPELATYYGISVGPGAADDDGFVRTDLPDDRYAGLITNGAFLTVQSLPNSSSPVQRGVAIREQLICDELPPPPENLDVSPPEYNPDQSTRERYEEHTSNEQCASCHSRIDGIGFALEHFDGIGRWRDLDGVHPIDASGEIIATPNTDATFDGAGELTTVLAESVDVDQCYLRQWVVFGFGSSTEEDEAIVCTEAEANTSFSSGSLSDAPLALASTTRFTERTGEPDELDTLAVSHLLGTLDTSSIGEPGTGDTDEDTGESSILITEAPMGLTVNVEINDWGSGYTAEFSMTNTTNAPITWEICAALEGTLVNSWNLTTTQNEPSEKCFSGVGYNDVVPANTTLPNVGGLQANY